MDINKNTSKIIDIDKEKCINCGVCTGVCNGKSLSLNRSTWDLQFKKELCIACYECVIACPVKAINMIN
ncbi:4Fe-4S dicluster domain-containing protein [Clostridium tunisiense]|uniref:4Fe-4S dicluster domain-containing protein n=1 Tax=Clostridium tunisiense TaxID=219748 RepID=UPI0003821943|nr:4Fe-4S binding protein [Clostridium tunisiense]